MAIIQPFRALRPTPESAAAVASRPYDVLNREEAVNEAAGNDRSFLHITKAEIDLPGDTGLHSQEVYDKAKENLADFRNRGILLQDETPGYYIYQLIMDGRSQTGLVCVSSVEDYFNNVIRKHEYTRPEKEKDRIEHMKTIRAQTGNVFLACNKTDSLDQLFHEWKERHEPLYDLLAGDGISHSIWMVNDPAVVDQITRIFRDEVGPTYIADGHHRAASAAKVSQSLPESKEAGFFLTTIFPADQLAILDYNRLVRDLNGLSIPAFLAEVSRDFEISQSSAAVKPADLHQFGMYLDKQWYRLTARPGTYGSDPVGVLDVSVLSANILDKILGITDQRTDTRIDFVGGIRGLQELEKRVDSGEMNVAFSLYPVTIRQLFDIADSGNVMPPKSTWFEPKLRDGLLTHLI